MHRTGHRPNIVVYVVVLVVMAGAVISCTADDATSVGKGGGTVVSRDKAVTVTFAPGQVDDSTRVRVDTAVDGPAPPPMVDPIDRPFDVAIKSGTARGGRVSVAFGALPEHLRGSPIFMFIEGGASGWQMLPTTVDPSSGVITAEWPHFTRGFLGRLAGWADDAKDGSTAAGRWAWEKVKKGARHSRTALRTPRG